MNKVVYGVLIAGVILFGAKKIGENYISAQCQSDTPAPAFNIGGDRYWCFTESQLQQLMDNVRKQAHSEPTT